MLLALIVVMTPGGWSAPEAATQVQTIQGTTTPFVDVASLKPTDRVFACDVAPVGNTCPGTAPNRQDDWWLVSDVFAPPPPPGVQVSASWPEITQDTKDQPITGVTYHLYFGQQGNEVLAQPNLTQTTTTVQAEYGIAYCGWVVAVYQGVVSEPGAQACFTLTKDVVKPKAPVSIEFKASATLQ